MPVGKSIGRLSMIREKGDLSARSEVSECSCETERLLYFVGSSSLEDDIDVVRDFLDGSKQSRCHSTADASSVPLLILVGLWLSSR